MVTYIIGAGRVGDTEYSWCTYIISVVYTSIYIYISYVGFYTRSHEKLGLKKKKKLYTYTYIILKRTYCIWHISTRQKRVNCAIFPQLPLYYDVCSCFLGNSVTIYLHVCVCEFAAEGDDDDDDGVLKNVNAPLFTYLRSSKNYTIDLGPSSREAGINQQTL